MNSRLASVLLTCLCLVFAADASQHPRELVEQNNLAVGLMGQYEYNQAVEILESLCKQYPDVLELKVNLAIATLNRQQPGDSTAGRPSDEERSLQLLEEVLSAAPSNLRAHYCSGLLAQRGGRLDDARKHFEIVATADPSDAYACYEYAQSLALDPAPENSVKALAWFERAIAADPYLRSCYYGAWQVLRQQRKAEEAAEHLKTFERLKDNPRAKLFALKYTEMGPKAEVVAFGEQSRPMTPPLPEGPLFSPSVDLVDGSNLPTWTSEPSRVSVTSVDVDGDGLQDLFLTRAVQHNDGLHNAVLLAGESGTYTWQPDHPLAGVTDVNAALWGDVDNDGKIDVYLCRTGANQLWRQTNEGWVDVTEDMGVASGDADTVDGAMVDADHDGDLDLFLVNAKAPNELLNNNRDGTFRPIAQDRGLDDGDKASRRVLFADFDNDRDLDLLVLHDQPPHSLFLNDRLWDYRRAEDADALLSADIIEAVAADLDVDGRIEVYGLTPEGLYCWQTDEQRRWAKTRIDAWAGKPGRDDRLAVADFDGDGVLELLASANQSTSVVRVHQPASLDSSPAEANPRIYGAAALVLAVASAALLLAGGVRRPALLAVSVVCLGVAGLLGYRHFESKTPPAQTNQPLVANVGEVPAASWGLTVREPGAGPELVLLTPEGQAKRLPAGSGRHRFTALVLSGKEDVGKSMRSNASGVGTRVHARIGGRWTAPPLVRQDSGPGQSHLPVLIGLGGADTVDFVSLDWPDGVRQTELKLGGAQLHTIVETQRQTSSCPVLFVWDGARHRFVTDLLGVGGLGYLLAPGEFAPADPTENLLLPDGILCAREGRYELKLTEPMEENCYLDDVKLVAYDLPAGWRMSLDERMHTGGPAPTGEPLFYRTLHLPAAAINDRGENVVDAVKEADLQAAPPGEVDPRFIGRLQREHVLTLEFEQPLDASSGPLALVSNGWIEYPYSQTMFAAWQAQADYRPPTLEACGSDGVWRVVLDQFGYPAGMPREMAVPLPPLPPGTKRLRLQTNQEIYWDRLAVVVVEPCPDAVRHELPWANAVLHAPGFAERRTCPQQRPDYDYDRRKPFWDCRNLVGMHTRFGPIEELLAEADNACVIFGPGEEVHLEFHADEPVLRAGWTRRHVLQCVGWCKDRDLFTRDGETVEPLPARGEVSEEAKRLQSRYNTRHLD